MEMNARLYMKLELKKYKRIKNPGYGKVLVKITSKSFVFSSATYRKYLANFKHMELYWDERNAVIAFVPISEENEDTFPIKCYRGNKSPLAIVNASEFIREHDLEKIDKDKNKFEIEEDEGKLLVRLKA
jgi:hypothetical protein